MTDDEKFFAWLDGDLDRSEAARVADIVRQDPSLQERAARYRELRQQAREAFAGDLDEPVPSAWADRIDTAFTPIETAEVFDLAAAREARHSRSYRWWRSGAIAASLVAAFVLGGLVPQGRPTLFDDKGGALVASSALADGLNEVRSGMSRTMDGQRFRVGLSVKTAAGRYCREAFLDGGSAAQHMLACRDGDDWRIQGLVGIDASGRGEYALASGSDSPIDTMLIKLGGAVLDRSGETRAIQHLWHAQR